MHKENPKSICNAIIIRGLGLTQTLVQGLPKSFYGTWLHSKQEKEAKFTDAIIKLQYIRVYHIYTSVYIATITFYIALSTAVYPILNIHRVTWASTRLHAPCGSLNFSRELHAHVLFYQFFPVFHRVTRACIRPCNSLPMFKVSRELHCCYNITIAVLLL